MDSAGGNASQAFLDEAESSLGDDEPRSYDGLPMVSTESQSFLYAGGKGAGLEIFGPRTQSRKQICFLCGGMWVALCLLFLLLNLLMFSARSLWDTVPASGSEYDRAAVSIPCHSHNDYWRKVPVFSALHVGCIGIEADVWLYNDDLFVGHTTTSLKPNRTFTSLYVDPITQILYQQNSLHTQNTTSERHDIGVYSMDPNQTLILLVDVKTDPDTTWPRVLEQLEPLRQRGWLSFVQDGTVHSRPVTVIGTGNTRFDLIMKNTTYRDAFFDAPLDRLVGPDYDTTNSYYTSVSFQQSIGSIKYGGLTTAQMSKIQSQVKEAHQRGLKVRYWDLPAWPLSVRDHVWQLLVSEGVDVLNVDDLRGAKSFLDKLEAHNPPA